MDSKWIELFTRFYSPMDWQFTVIKSLGFVLVALSLLAGIRSVLTKQFGFDSSAMSAALAKAKAELDLPYKRPRLERMLLVVEASIFYALAAGVVLQYIQGSVLLLTRDATALQRTGVGAVLVALCIVARWMFANGERARYKFRQGARIVLAATTNAELQSSAGMVQK